MTHTQSVAYDVSVNTGNNRDEYTPINDYAPIGNCRSAALVGLNGSIDWCCFPRFDSPSVFSAILDAVKGGAFAITPKESYSATQRYIGDTNVLETRLESERSVCTITDCMPLYLSPDGSPVELHEIVRTVRCQQGRVELSVDYSPRDDYARAPVTLAANGTTVHHHHGHRELTLETPLPLKITAGHAVGTLFLVAGEEASFVLSFRDSTTNAVFDGTSPAERVERTKEYWQDLVSELDYKGYWREEVIRSFLVLRLMMYLPTGAFVASLTTSLPERIGGIRNWDYRFTWLRDASFTVDALMRLGDKSGAAAFFDWLCRVALDTFAIPEEDLRIMYRVDGSVNLLEEELSHLEGYRGSKPVRVGNGAHGQVQLDIYGEVMDSLHLFVTTEDSEGGRSVTDDEWGYLSRLAYLAARHWKEPGSGIWEIRGDPFHFVYSKVMCWVALDRAVALATKEGIDVPEVTEWARTAEEIKIEVLERGWNEEKQAFVQHYDTDAMDASNLLIPLMGFLPFDDPRIVSTVKRIREELGTGPFVRRYRTDELDDGLPGTEGAFTFCSFWLIRVLAGMGEVEEARRLYEELLYYSNHLGLFSEMVDPQTGEALGNFPQAFTHIGLIRAAEECNAAIEASNEG